MSTLLSVKNLSVRIRSRDIIKNISFAMDTGECIALVGESGSGKSMTAHALLHLLPDDTSVSVEGTVLFSGANILEMTKSELRSFRGKEIAIIFQQAQSALNPLMRVGTQILESVLTQNNFSKQKGKEIVLELLEFVGFPQPVETYNSYPHVLSGGMRQRIMIAIALACNPKLLIADEPTTALDVTTQAEIMKLIQKIRTEKNMSVLLITHDLALVSGFAEKIYVMKDGEIVDRGTTDYIFYESDNSYTRMLLAQKERWSCNVR